ncbi:MAG: restriction endonuclease subunit S [Candidatus Methanoperedens sp.]
MKTLPDGWKKYKIRDIGTVVTGNTPPKNETQNYDGDLPWIKPPDLDNGMFVSTSVDTISEFGRKKIRLLPKGSVLVSCIGNIGKVAIAECELCTNQQINSIIPYREIVDSVFIYYAIKRIRPKLEEAASSFVVPLLNKTDFSNIELSIPPLPTQKKIAVVLEKAEKLREWRKEADGLTDAFLKSTFLEMFGDPATNPKGWKVKKINDVVEIEAGSCVIGEKRPRKENEFAVLMVSAVTKGIFLPNEYKVINSSQILKKIVTPEKGDLLFSRANTYELVGATCLIGENYPYLLLPDKLWKIKPDISRSCSEYLKFVLSHAAIRKEISNNASGTSGSMLNISMSKLKSININIPPIELQQKFAHIVHQVEQIREHQTQSRQHIENLFNVLMQRAFRGELEIK